MKFQTGDLILYNSITDATKTRVELVGLVVKSELTYHSVLKHTDWYYTVYWWKNGTYDSTFNIFDCTAEKMSFPRIGHVLSFDYGDPTFIQYPLDQESEVKVIEF